MDPNTTQDTIQTPTPKPNHKKGVVILAVVIILMIVWLIAKDHSSVSQDNADKYSNNSTLQTLSFDNITAANAPANAIPLETRKRAVQAFQRSYDDLTSGDVVRIRSAMVKQAKTPAEKHLVSILKDGDILSLSSRLSAMLVKPSVDILLDPNAIWTIDGQTVTVKILQAKGATTTLSTTI